MKRIANAADILREQAYLVARGVRPMALLGECETDSVTVLEAYTALEREAGDGVIAFTVDRGDGITDLGYAASPWVVDLYRWLTADDAVPETHQHRIIGLLLGYSPSSIRAFEERSCSRPERVC